jgi:hypothetical protein
MKAAMIILVVFVLLYPSAAVPGPDGGQWIACVKACGRSYRVCYKTCDITSVEFPPSA